MFALAGGCDIRVINALEHAVIKKSQFQSGFTLFILYYLFSVKDLTPTELFILSR